MLSCFVSFSQLQTGNIQVCFQAQNIGHKEGSDEAEKRPVYKKFRSVEQNVWLKTMWFSKYYV